MKLKYEKLSQELENRISEDRLNNTLPKVAFKEENVLRRNPDKDKSTLLRPAFQRDIEKIKYRNDELSIKYQCKRSDKSGQAVHQDHEEEYEKKSDPCRDE